MAKYSFKNYSESSLNPLPKAESGDIFESCNFVQLKPHTIIFEGLEKLTFISCNLTNCDIPSDSKCESCKPYHVEFCSHVIPKMAERGLIPVCPENCTHVVDTDELIIDGLTIDTIYHYANKVVE